MKTRAVWDRDVYVLNGEKCYITFAPVADYILIFARVGDVSDGTRNISAFIVEAKTPGVTIRKNERELGLNGIPNAPVYLENVKVPVENRVGEEGDGFRISMGSSTGRAIAEFQGLFHAG